ncbi:fibrinogen C domain-containing protein 1-like, partial [Anopheles marshallii]|uniref:fibrinogen C domain-containing protein 1-like n=1 Tax=Anopheles marshallii TaxID=1521116 RepID=UPI00237B9532
MKLSVLVLSVGCMLCLVSANTKAIESKFVKSIAKLNHPSKGGSYIDNCGCHAIEGKLKILESNLLKFILNLRNKYGAVYSNLIDMKKNVKSVSWYVGQRRRRTLETSHRINEQLLGDSVLLAQIMHTIREIIISQQKSVTKTFLTESFLDLEKRVGEPKRPASVLDTVYTSCDDARITRTGTYLVQDAFGEPTKVICVLEFLPGAYTVIQNRHEGSTDFYRGYSDYRSGFGEFDGGDYWLGLDRINNITASGDYELMILLEDFEKNVTYAHYDNFAVGSGNDFYPITKLDGYSGTAGDSLRSLVGVLFSAYDLDLDYSEGNCAVSNRGAWWYTDCGESNLNGFYLKGLSSSTTGMFWKTFRGAYYSLKRSRMMIKRKEMASTTAASTTMSTESTSMTTTTGDTTTISTSTTAPESSSTDASTTMTTESVSSTTTTGDTTTISTSTTAPESSSTDASTTMTTESGSSTTTTGDTTT